MVGQDKATPKKPPSSKPSFRKNPKPFKTKTRKKNPSSNDAKTTDKRKKSNDSKNPNSEIKNLVPPPASEQLKFFLGQYESANGVQLSSLELESIKDTSILELSEGLNPDTKTVAKQIKDSFGPLWNEKLCENNLVEGEIEPGCPAVLAIATSAIRSIELLRGFRSLTKECHAAKLFSKHIKVEEQGLWEMMMMYNFSTEAPTPLRKDYLHVAFLKNRVNIAGGTPSRIKKLIDIEALGLSHLSVILLDLQTDVKGYSLLTLPQVRDEFWDLYKNYFHQLLIEGNLRICLYGPLIPAREKSST